MVRVEVLSEGRCPYRLNFRLCCLRSLSHGIRLIVFLVGRLKLKLCWLVRVNFQRGCVALEQLLLPFQLFHWLIRVVTRVTTRAFEWK